MSFEVSDRVKILRPNGGGYDYGTVCAKAKSAFDGTTLYIVDFESKSLTLTEQSIIKVRSRKKKAEPIIK